jgi:hypothetical protein
MKSRRGLRPHSCALLAAGLISVASIIPLRSIIRHANKGVAFRTGPWILRKNIDQREKKARKTRVLYRNHQQRAGDVKKKTKSTGDALEGRSK